MGALRVGGYLNSVSYSVYLPVPDSDDRHEDCTCFFLETNSYPVVLFVLLQIIHTFHTCPEANQFEDSMFDSVKKRGFGLLSLNQFQVQR